MRKWATSTFVGFGVAVACLNVLATTIGAGLGLTLALGALTAADPFDAAPPLAVAFGGIAHGFAGLLLIGGTRKERFVALGLQAVAVALGLFAWLTVSELERDQLASWFVTVAALAGVQWVLLTGAWRSVSV